MNYETGLRGTLGHSSKEIGDSSLGRFAKNTTPLTAAPTTRSRVSLKSVLSRPTKIQASGVPPGHFVVSMYNGGVTTCQSELLL